MMNEAFNRNFKRLVLRLANRPRLDKAFFLLITEAIPPYRLTYAKKIAKTLVLGRAEGPSHYQAALKKAWIILSTRPIHGTYETDLLNMTCDCGAQKYHAYLLCKHLVQGLPKPPDWWWSTAVRFHYGPFYHMPCHDTNTPGPVYYEKIRDKAWLKREVVAFDAEEGYTPIPSSVREFYFSAEISLIILEFLD
jgi:hypothetical protein